MFLDFLLPLKWHNINNFSFKYPKTTRKVSYFADLCTRIIPNVSKDVIIQRHKNN